MGRNVDVLAEKLGYSQLIRLTQGLTVRIHTAWCQGWCWIILCSGCLWMNHCDISPTFKTTLTDGAHCKADKYRHTHCAASTPLDPWNLSVYWTRGKYSIRKDSFSRVFPISFKANSNFRHLGWTFFKLKHKTSWAASPPASTDISQPKAALHSFYYVALEQHFM